MTRRTRRQQRNVVVAALSVAAALSLVACSGEVGSTASSTQVTTPAPTSSPTASEAGGSASPTSTAIPQEIAPGVNPPVNPVQPSQTPQLLRPNDVKAVTEFAQGLANELMYLVGVFAPKPNNEPLSAVDLQFISGLSAFALDEYYSWVFDDKTYRANADKVAGLVFIPEQNAGKRAYAIPAVQQVKYSNVNVAEGPPSSIDGSPTIRVSFTLSGNLMWQDEQGQSWIAPAQRKISYVIADQNENWSLDSWVPSKVEVGPARNATEDEVTGIQFSLLDAPDREDFVAPLPSSFPKATNGNNR